MVRCVLRILHTQSLTGMVCSVHGSSRIPSYKSATRRAADNANYADAGSISSARESKPNYGHYMQSDKPDMGVEVPQQRMYMDGEHDALSCHVMMTLP
jgi:hypothetical protein